MRYLLFLTACHSSTLLYVSNEDSDDISVIDTKSQRVVKTIPVGKRPRGLRLSRDGKTLYVAVTGNSKSAPPDRSADGIAVVDVKTGTVTRTLESGNDPESFDFAGERVFVSNEDSSRVSVVDMTSGRVIARVAVGAEPEGVTTRPGDGEVWVTSEAEGTVFVINTDTLVVTGRIPVGARPRTVVFSKDGRTAYVSNESGGSISVIDAITHTHTRDISMTSTAARPMGLALLGEQWCVSTGRGKAIECGDRVVPDVGARPWGIVARDRTLYSANGPSNDVSVIDIAAGRVLTKIPVGSSPWGVAISQQ